MIEILKQAIEALEYFDERAATINEIQMARPVLLHLRQAIKELESQEPFAWQVEVYINDVWSPMGNPQLNKSRAEALASNPSIPKEKQRIVELYTTPPQRTEQEPDWKDGVMEQQAETILWQAKRIAELESQEPFAWMSLMKEARDNCKASIVEDGISEMRKEYRIDLERRLTDCINTHPPQRTEPIQSLQCFHCQVTIETLNDKVMQLMAQRTWVGLTDKDVMEVWGKIKDGDWALDFYDVIEAKLKELNK